MKLVNLTDALAERFGDKEAVRITCEAGFDGIDFSMFRMNQDDNDILNSADCKNHVAEMLNIAKSYGVTFEQAHAPFPSAKEKDVVYTEKMKDILKRSLEIAGALDAKICIVHPVQFSTNQFERNMELYHSLEPYAADYGVKIAVENMWGWDNVAERIVPNVCSVAEDFNRYVDALNPEHFTACLDLGHCGLVGDNAGNMIRQMGSRLGALHIHDNNNIDDSHSLPYLGVMDWNDILRALGETDYQGNFTYEVGDFLRAFPDDVVLSSEKFMHDLGRSMMRKIEEYRIKK